jgi:hypothetical protein
MATFTTEIEINDNDIEVTAEYEYEAPCGDGWYEPHFDEQINVYSVKDKDGNEVEITKGHEAYLMEKISEHLVQQGIEYEADKAEYEYELAMELRFG